jgi:hypothetical protein
LKFEGDDGIVVLVSAKRTHAGSPVLRKGPFKGKRVELASTAGIQTFDEIALLEIFRRLQEHQAIGSRGGLAQ